MSNGSANERITVGQIVGVFGVKGWVKVKSFTEPEENIVEYEPWWLRTKHGLKQVEVDEFVMRPQGLIVHIKGCDDRDAAEQLAKSKIDVEQALLPSLDEGDFYWHQLIGLKVVSEHNGARYDFGTVSKMLETGANDVLVVKGGDDSLDDKERLIPYVPDLYVKDIDLEQQQILVEWDPDF